MTADIPADSPLAQGWRSTVVELIRQHGIHELFDTLAAYAELVHRRDPGIDPLDLSAPARRRINGKCAILTAECKASGRHRGFIPQPGRIQVAS